MSEDGIERVRAALAAQEEVDLPEGIDLPPAEGDAEADYPEGYLPPPAPPSDDRPDGPDEPPNPVALAAKEPQNDLGNANRFVIHFGADVRHVSQVGWHIWDGRRWRKDAEISKGLSPRIRQLTQMISGLIEQEIDFLEPSRRERKLLEEEQELRRRRIAIEAMPGYAGDEALITELGNIEARFRAIDAALKSYKEKIKRRLTHAKNAGNSGPMTNMAAEAQVMRSVTVDDLDQSDLDVNTLTGVLRFRIDPFGDLGMGPKAVVELITHAREQMLSKLAPVEYDPDATCPNFDEFLRQIQPNIEMRQFLQRWFGLSMSGIPVQKLAFFHGAGANGKSVLVDIISRIMGDYSVTAKIESLTGKSKKSGSDSQPDLIPLIGARSVRTSEPEEGEKLQEALVKALTGGEPMMIRDLFSGMILFQPYFKLTISGNHLPEIRGGDDGIWRRVLLVKFPIQIPEHKRRPKKDMDAMLWEERSGILNWMVQGLLDFLDGGLQEPDEVVAATESYRKDSDPIGTFLADATIVTGYEGDFMTSRELIDAFNFWIEERGEPRWGGRKVSMRLKGKSEGWRHPETQKMFMPGKSGVTGYRGIRLAEEFGRRIRESKDAETSRGWSSWDR
ncbi:MAG: phage/plasmid primase, P4 family [Paracoccus sp. (in: a-proteobacteria)]|uniref:DNA primase family protein n=1 Tax=Paracoccus sp. TaxID=267 RepID=UPI00391A0F7E